MPSQEVTFWWGVWKDLLNDFFVFLVLFDPHSASISYVLLNKRFSLIRKEEMCTTKREANFVLCFTCRPYVLLKIRGGKTKSVQVFCCFVRKSHKRLRRILHIFMSFYLNFFFFYQSHLTYLFNQYRLGMGIKTEIPKPFYIKPI